MSPVDPAAGVLLVALPVPLPRLFSYFPAVDGPAAAVGARVRVPFGPRELVGVVTAIPDAPGDPGPLKPVHAVLDSTPLFAGELLASLRWLARYTHEIARASCRERV